MNKKTLVISLCTSFALVILIISGIIFYKTSVATASELSNTRDLFTTEEEYISFIKNNVNFNDISLSVVNIQKGDNYWKLAKQYNINIDTLIGANPFWDDLLAKATHEVVIPSEKGCLHFVTRMENIEEIAAKYQVSTDKIAIQKLPPFYKYYYRLKKEQKPIAIFVKGEKPEVDFLTDKLAKQYSLRETFRSPLGGRYSSFYGNRKHPIFHVNRFHDGVDIAAPYGTLIGSASDGYIKEAGWMGGYGKAVIIEHPNGFKTLYGHMSKINVRKGQTVKKGSIIGKVGSTGWSTGPHLHFTLWHNGKLINPMQVLW